MEKETRGRKPVEIYCYQHKELKVKAPSIKTAAQLADTSSTMVRKIAMGQVECTRDGWIFTYEPLTKEELQHAPDRWEEKQNLKRVGRECFKAIDDQEYEVDCKHSTVTYIPRKKEEKKMLLRQIVYNACSTRWQLIPRKVATLERTAISELINSF